MDFLPLANNIVHLQPLQRSDFDRLYAVASEKEIWAQHPDFNRYLPAGFQIYFDKLMETDMPYLIFSKEDGKIMGATSYYQYDAEKRAVSIGFTFLATAYWGGKFNRIIKSLLLDHAFQFVDKVVFHVREGNLRSQHALIKLGALKSSEYPAPADPTTVQYEFVLTKEQWENN
ncbi:GNAT family N-acetyltransferase [Sphingobacterium sp. LRF_L2]|uniref:GNAT family N-acetyltransferase n=1 Tax=Sphingobacterium sp. LRF_L2 TaxID=3369421 RepID=UPI003F6394A1